MTDLTDLKRRVEEALIDELNRQGGFKFYERSNTGKLIPIVAIKAVDVRSLAAALLSSCEQGGVK